MKKLFITIAFVAATMFASAQLYVGGSLGMTTQNGKETEKIGSVSTTYDGLKRFDFSFAPEVGFMFADNMGVGLRLGVEMTNITYPKGDNIIINGWSFPVANDETGKIKQTTLSFAPYFRYVFAEVDNFKFYADACVSFSTAKPKINIKGENTSTDYTDIKSTTLGFGIYPGMAYMLTDNISMNCKLNVLSLYFESKNDKYTDTDYEDTNKTTEFGFGVNQSTPVEIGFFYTF